MNLYLGDFTTANVVYIYFPTYDKDDGSSITMTGLAVTDIEIYRDGSTTQRSSDAGITLLDTDGIDFDGITGIHGFSIDLADNTDSGFYAAGHEYTVIVSAVTVDSVNISFVAGSFSIERTGGALALLKNATYGLAQLVRSTTPANTLTVDTSHRALSDLASILGTALTETAGQIAAAFKKFFDKASPTGTINSLPDAVAGAANGLPTTNGTKLSQTADLTSGQSIAIGSGGITSTSFATGAITAAAIAADAEYTGEELAGFILAGIVEGDYTVKDVMRILLSSAGCKLTVTDNEDGTHTYTWRDTTDGTNRVVAVVNDTTYSHTITTLSGDDPA